MNKEIYKLKIEGKIEDLESSDEKMTIKTENNSIEIYTYHEQDCCEHVYGDFSSVKYHIEELKAKDIKEITIKSVSDMGILLCFMHGYDSYVKIFIPCYNSQNGYYSSNLKLVIKHNEIETSLDISDSVEDDID